MDKNYKMFFATLVAAIIIISTFAVMVQTGVLRLGISSVQVGEGRPLFLQIFVDETSGTIPFAVNFTSLVLYYVGDVSYKWDFGDGNTSDEINPMYTYTENGTFFCNLTITDSTGKKSSDVVEIFAKGNEPPQVIIKLPATGQRPYIPGLPKLTDLSKGMIYEQLLEKSRFPESLLNLKGFIESEAQVLDPEGDEIVSYEWELRPPFYKSIAGKTTFPSYYFYGKNVSFPLLYTYRLGRYIVTLRVTDSAGNIAEDTKYFDVFQSTIEDYRQKFTDFRAVTWPLSLYALFAAPVAQFIAKNWDKLDNYPLLQTIIAFRLTFQWKIKLTEYVDNLFDSIIIKSLDKYPSLKPLIKNILVGIQSYCEKTKDRFPNLKIALIEKIQLVLEKYGLDNKRPVISNPFPRNEDKNIPRDCPYVSINVTDHEGDRFNVTIFGDYVNDKYYDNVTTGVFNATLITPLPPVTDINWQVKVIDLNGKVVEANFEFTTFSI